MDDGSGSTPAGGQEPGEQGDRATDRLLEDLVRTMTAMEDGRQPATALDAVATPLAARRIQSMVLHEQAERRRRRQRRPRTVPTIVRTSKSFHPTAGVTEGVVLVREDQRTRAYCVRLQRYGPDWRVVELARPDTALLPVVTRASREGRLSTEPSRTHRRSRRGGPSCHLDHLDGVDGGPATASESDGEDAGGVAGHEDGSAAI